MFFPYTDYKQVDVPQMPGLGETPTNFYTTTGKCIVHFEPIVSRMRSPASFQITALSVPNSGGINFGVNNIQIYSSVAGDPSLIRQYILPPGTTLQATFQNTQTLVGGTLHVFFLPET